MMNYPLAACITIHALPLAFLHWIRSLSTKIILEWSEDEGDTQNEVSAVTAAVCGLALSYSNDISTQQPMMF